MLRIDGGKNSVEEMHPETGKADCPFNFALGIIKLMGKPYRRDSEHPDYQSMNPARLLDFEAHNEELMAQVKEALCFKEKM